MGWTCGLGGRPHLFVLWTKSMLSIQNVRCIHVASTPKSLDKGQTQSKMSARHNWADPWYTGSPAQGAERREDRGQERVATKDHEVTVRCMIFFPEI